jgi:hypothetical protein
MRAEFLRNLTRGIGKSYLDDVFPCNKGFNLERMIIFGHHNFPLHDPSDIGGGFLLGNNPPFPSSLACGHLMSCVLNVQS